MIHIEELYKYVQHIKCEDRSEIVAASRGEDNKGLWYELDGLTGSGELQAVSILVLVLA